MRIKLGLPPFTEQLGNYTPSRAPHPTFARRLGDVQAAAKGLSHPEPQTCFCLCFMSSTWELLTSLIICGPASCTMRVSCPSFAARATSWMRTVQWPRELLPTTPVFNLIGRIFLYPTWFPPAIVKPTASHLHVFYPVEAPGTHCPGLID